MAHDASQGILSQAEVRAKLQDIYGTARYADTHSIASASEKMLAVITQEGYNSPKLPTAIDDMGHACESIGA